MDERAPDFSSFYEKGDALVLPIVRSQQCLEFSAAVNELAPYNVRTRIMLKRESFKAVDALRPAESNNPEDDCSLAKFFAVKVEIPSSDIEIFNTIFQLSDFSRVKDDVSRLFCTKVLAVNNIIRLKKGL